MNQDFNNNEKIVLINLNNNKRFTPEELAQACNSKVETVTQAAFMLEEKGLVLIEESFQETFILTKEGEEYSKNGLPERQLISVINSPISLETIKQKIDQKIIGIATGWVRKKKWASIEHGNIIPINNAEVGQDEKILELLNKNENIEPFDKNVMNTLIKRGLVDKNEEKTRTISITEAGKNLVSSGITLEEEITQITSEMLKNGEWKGKKFRPYNIHAPAKPIYGAKIHPYQVLINQMRQIFLEMGFTEIKGDIVQCSFWNFDALFQPQDHPAREMQDTFHLDTTSELPVQYKDKVCAMHEHGGELNSKGWGGKWSEEIAVKNVLRTHTTSVTIKYLADRSSQPPIKAFSIDRAYRRETIDPTHTPEFEQLEGVVMDEGMTFAHLLGLLSEFYHRIGFKDVRFRPGYFPYTEPSVEPEVYVEELGWVELGGAGVFRKEVTEPLGIKYPVLAWGLGVSRLAMLKLNLTDLRELYQSDLGWLRKTPYPRL